MFECFKKKPGNATVDNKITEGNDLIVQTWQKMTSFLDTA
jgi:hypothetical protein